MELLLHLRLPCQGRLGGNNRARHFAAQLTVDSDIA
jgi:hypothetical protein